MPVFLKRLAPWPLMYVRPAPPFDLLDLIDTARADFHDNPAESVLDLPLLMDFRAIDLLRFHASDFQTLLRERLSLRPPTTTTGSGSEKRPVTTMPAAFIARDDGSFGMLRMYTIYSEVGGYRNESEAFVTCAPDEALNWMYQRLNTRRIDGLADTLAKDLASTGPDIDALRAALTAAELDAREAAARDAPNKQNEITKVSW